MQQLIEILISPIVSMRWSKDEEKDKKKVAIGIVSFLVALLVIAIGGMRVLKPLMGDPAPNDVVDIVVTALVISAGTEGFNSILKFLGYSKDKQDADAAKTDADATKAKADATKAKADASMAVAAAQANPTANTILTAM